MGCEAPADRQRRRRSHPNDRPKRQEEMRPTQADDVAERGGHSTPASRRWLAAEYVGCRAGRASQAVGEARVRRRREAKELARRCPTARPHGEPHIFHKSTVDRGPAQCFSWRHRAERYQKSAFHVRRLAACAQRCAIQALRAPAFTAPAFTRRHGRIPLVTHLSCRGGLTIGAFTAGTCCASARK